MKGKTHLYALLVFVVTWAFCAHWSVYSLLQQEEVQLFIPTWPKMSSLLLTPGGCCEFIGKAIVQCYSSPFAVSVILATLITCVAYLTYSLLEHLTTPRIDLYFWALLPIWVLLKAHSSPFFVLDGTIGILLLLIFLYGYCRIPTQTTKLIYASLSTLIIYFLCGQMVALYSIILSIFTLLKNRREWNIPVLTSLLGLGLTYISIQLTPCVPITDGIYSQAYQESQLQPDSYLYFISLRWTGLLLASFIITYILGLSSWNRTCSKICLILVSGGVLALYVWFHLPNQEDILNNKMEKLSYLCKQKDWTSIIKEFESQPPTNYYQHNYLSLALAQKGILGDQLFKYNPRGPQSLIATWDRRYYSSAILSEIHFAIGDVTLSESYAMEGLTLAKRGGSPRMMQQLVKISLVRQEWELARKYLHILRKLPSYKEWAEKYSTYLIQPEKMTEDIELSQRAVSKQPDNLFSLLTIDNIWKEHFDMSPINPFAQAYVGCSYLLSKELDKFEQFLLKLKGTSLPKHFQEATLILALEHPEILDSLNLDIQTVNLFKLFQQDVRMVSKDNRGLMNLQRKYGETYWFYYYCKN